MSVFKSDNKRQLRLNFLLPQSKSKPKAKAKSVLKKVDDHVIDIKPPVKDTQQKTKTSTSTHHPMTKVMYFLCYVPIYLLEKIHRVNGYIISRHHELLEKQTNSI